MALAKHILKPEDLEGMSELTDTLASIAEEGKLIVAANSNLPFLAAYPALLPFVMSVSGSEEISSSISTIRLLNSLI